MEDLGRLKEQRDIAAATAFYWMRQAALIALRAGESGIVQWQRVMREGLHAAYEKMGASRNSGPENFLKYVIERDRALGLEAGGEIKSGEEFVYWIKDPFIPLRNMVDDYAYERLSTRGYLKAKIDYFCPEFTPSMTKSPWRGDDRTEWVLYNLKRR